MKKAKIMLSAITVLAVVGGALAFTAKNSTTTLYTVNDGTNHCTTSKSYITTTGTPSTGTISASNASGGVCTTFTLTTADN